MGLFRGSLGVKRYFAREDGTTAIEFSLLLIPYIMLIVGIMEVSMMFASASMLEGATGTAARLIRTGQLQQGVSEDAESLFKQAMCDYALVLISCDDVTFEVQVMDDFSSYSNYAPSYDEDGNMVSSGFSIGGVSDKILVRTAYRYYFITPLIGQLLGGTTQSRLFISTIIFQTEPYEFEG